MQEVVITFETAKLAYEKGFHHMKANIYGDNLHYHRDDPEGTASAMSQNIVRGTYLAPTQSLLQKWLRDTHGINMVIMSCIIPSNETKYYTFKGRIKWDWNELFDSYEEALEALLQESLKLLRDESST